MKAHGLLERVGRGYRCRLTDKGTKAALMFILFHQRVCGPLANSLFHHRPAETSSPPPGSKRPTITPSNTCSTCLPPEILRDEFSKPAVLETNVFPRASPNVVVTLNPEPPHDITAARRISSLRVM